jgi:putative FmdB family regulatory protein
MPYYDYKCPEEHRFIEQRSMHENKVAVCPMCKKEGIRLYTPPLVKFKGDGFYSNDKNATVELDI